MPKSCVYNGSEYSHGSVTCQNGYEYKCNDGEWDALGTSCGRFVEKSTGEVVDPDLRLPPLPCVSFFGAGIGRVGIRNNCPECKYAVVNWLPRVGIRRYRVEGHNQVIIDTEDNTGLLIGEDPC